jgi:hypothetical protein
VLVVSGCGSCHDRIKRPLKPEPGPEQRATPEPRFPIPIVWVEGVASLDDRDPPSEVPRHRWRLFVDDCKRFVASDWAGRAAQLGWNAMSLFGCAPKRPLDYSGSAGLLWALNGGRLVQLHRDWAVIDVPVNRSTAIERPGVNAVLGRLYRAEEDLA